MSAESHAADLRADAGAARSTQALARILPGAAGTFSVLAASSVLSIPAGAIDHAQARGLDRNRSEASEQPSGWSVLIACKPLLVFAACVALFHFANAPMLPLVGQKLALALAHAGAETALMSACIIAAQLVMLPMALLVGTKADAWGRKPILLAALAVLPLRGMLYTLSDDRYWLVAVQLLDGVGNGIFGAMTPVVVADLMRGAGRYNVSLGVIATVHGIGASLSNTMAGLIVVHAGYNVAFLTLATIALAGFAIFLVAMPETGELGKVHQSAARYPIRVAGANMSAAAKS